MHNPLLARFLVVCLLALTACTPPARAVPSQAIEAAYTSAAETVLARLTQEAGEAAVAELTRLASQPSQTATSLTPSPTPPSTATLAPSPLPPTPTRAPLPTSTPLPPTPTPGLPCDAAGFIAHGNVPPETSLISGGRFNKSWLVRNTGACTWTRAYSIAFSGGVQLGGATLVSLLSPVRPGETVELFAPMVAPGAPGTYQSFWTLRNAQGAAFGVSGTDTGLLETSVRVFQPAGWGTAALDFAADACAAAWRSESQSSLPCPGDKNDANGAVVFAGQAGLEINRTGEYGLWTRPSRTVQGWITGQYPAYPVRVNDHFLAELACLAGSQGCDVEFSLSYNLPGGRNITLGAWFESYDGQTTQVDLDLSALAGQTVQFTLAVRARGPAALANAYWVRPRLQNLGPRGTRVLNWRRENPGQTGCDELRVYLFSNITAEAQAYSCIGGERLLGRITLSADQLNQLLAWIRALSTFEGEIYQATSVQPVLIQLRFSGSGSGQAQDSDIQALSNYALALYNQAIR